MLRNKLLSLYSFLVFFQFNCFAQVKIISWNIQNFGIQKVAHIGLIANLLKDADIVVVQEVQIDSDGTKAISLLEVELEKTGKVWNSTVSLPTHGKGTECYAFLWQSSNVTLIEPAWLEMSLDSLIDREPYMARFKNKDKTILLANFHAVPKKKMPWVEIRELDRLDQLYKTDNLILVGDFNLQDTDISFDELKSLGFSLAFHEVKTTIKMELQGQEKFANAYDNFIYKSTQFYILEGNRLDFTDQFCSLQEARKVSDHLPVYILVK